MAAVLGNAPWSPKPETMATVHDVLEILDEYRDFLPLTGRQVFYRLVGNYGFPKREQDYKRLLSYINRARRAGMIPWNSIRDDGVTVSNPGRGYDSPEDFLATLRSAADLYRRNVWQNQTKRVEIWVEAAGMVPQMRGIAERYGAVVYSSGGFNSSTMKHDAAVRFHRRAIVEGKQTAILHVGDHDPSGVAIFENIRDDIDQFLHDFRGGAESFVRFERVAVTEAQALDMDLESAPPKKTDSRSVNWEGETWQAEAIAPNDLQDIVDTAVARHVDFDMLESTGEMSQIESGELVQWIDEAIDTWSDR